jgi:hypothetical protein
MPYKKICCVMRFIRILLTNMKIIKIVVVTAFVFLSLLVCSLFLSNSLNKENKYELSFNTGSNLVLTIASNLIKPIIEIYLDSRLENSRFLDRIKEKNFADKMLVRSIIKSGEGQDIICGQTIVIDISGDLIQTKRRFKYRVGTSDIKILNIAPIGMKKGELSGINIPGFLTQELLGNNFNTPNASLAIEIVDVIDSYPNYEIKMFTQDISNQRAKMCGDSIDLLYRVKDINLKEMYSEKVKFKIGDSNLPILFNTATIGMQPNIERTVIASRNLVEKTDKKEAVIVEMMIYE